HRVAQRAGGDDRRSPPRPLQLPRSLPGVERGGAAPHRPRTARSTALPATVAAAAGARGAEGPDGIAAGGAPYRDRPRTRVRLPAAPHRRGAAPECRPRAPPRRGVLPRPGGG